MLPAERRQTILEIIQEQGSATVEQLIEVTGTSQCTIRRDLDKLAATGLVSRTHGGAVLNKESTSFEHLYSEKRALNLAEKRRIGKVAAEMVVDGESLILDSGSTTLEIARNLTNKKNLTIITNDLMIATEIQYDPTTEVMVTGGSLRPGFNVLCGAVAEAFLRTVNVNKAFISGDAIDLARGLTNANFAEAALKSLMTAAARKVYLALDHSKFGKTSLARVQGIDAFDAIITDNGLSSEHQELLERLGIQYHLA